MAIESILGETLLACSKVVSGRALGLLDSVSVSGLSCGLLSIWCSDSCVSEVFCSCPSAQSFEASFRRTLHSLLPREDFILTSSEEWTGRRMGSCCFSMASVFLYRPSFNFKNWSLTQKVFKLATISRRSWVHGFCSLRARWLLTGSPRVDSGHCDVLLCEWLNRGVIFLRFHLKTSEQRFVACLVVYSSESFWVLCSHFFNFGFSFDSIADQVERRANHVVAKKVSNHRY